MTQAVAPTTDAWMTKVGDFLTSLVPTGTEILRGPINRVALPKLPCVVFTPLFHKRLRTNLHTDDDVYPLTGSTTATEEAIEQYVQFDFYGPESGDWSAAAEMLWRDEYGCNMLNPDASPLYTNDARMVPLVTGEEQYLERYTLTAVLQWNAVTSIPQEFADEANVVLINVDSTYPP